MKTETNSSSGAMVIYNFENKDIDLNLPPRFCSGPEDIKLISFVKKNLIHPLPFSFIAIL